MDEQLRAIADPTRRRILELAQQREYTAGEIAERFDMTRPGVSQHLKVLLGVDLLTVRREATRRYYRANAQGLALLRKQLDRFWVHSLRELKQKAEREARRRK